MCYYLLLDFFMWWVVYSFFLFEMVLFWGIKLLVIYIEMYEHL
jgi:hypothetical protein